MTFKYARILKKLPVNFEVFLILHFFFYFQVACLTYVAANYLNCKIDAKRWGTAHGSIVPYQVNKA